MKYASLHKINILDLARVKIHIARIKQDYFSARYYFPFKH